MRSGTAPPNESRTGAPYGEHTKVEDNDKDNVDSQETQWTNKKSPKNEY